MPDLFFFQFRYGTKLAKSLTKLVFDRGYQPFVVIRPENDASRGLYTKLGFQKAFSTVRGVFKPYMQNVENEAEEECVTEEKCATEVNGKENGHACILEENHTTEKTTANGQLHENALNAADNEEN